MAVALATAMTPPWNSTGLLGGPERRVTDRRARERLLAFDRRRQNRRKNARTAILAAALSSTPAARPAMLLPPLKPKIEVSTEFVALPPNKSYDALIDEAAAEHEMDPDLIRAVMQAESAFHPLVVSRAGAEGLMQLMPELATEMGVTDSFDPRDNIMGGVRYLKRLLDFYKGDLDLALAGYNAGPGNVERYGGVPPFEETRRYIKTIKQLLKESRASNAD
jgi:soluble lytic murein transglycosylase-like protein